MFSLIPWRERREISRLRRDIDEMFDRFFEGWPSLIPGSLWEGGWAPSVDISETGKEVIVKAELPGMKAEDIDISLTGDQLHIRGERQQEKEEKEENFHRVERFYGSFARTITLPAEVNPDKIKATYKDGVLTVRLPKAKEEAVKKIEVKAA